MKKAAWLGLLTALMLTSTVFTFAQTALTEKPLWQPYYVTPRGGPDHAGQHLDLNGDWQLGWRDAQINSVAELANQSKWIRATPQPALTLDKGPWLKPRVAATTTALALKLEAAQDISDNRSRFKIRVQNTGTQPAFNTQLNIQGVKRAFHATDNFFWLSPGEERALEIEVLWRDPANRAQAVLTCGAWNAQTRQTPVGQQK